jgi:hypothetical protein
MADSGIQAVAVAPEILSGGAIPFQFEVSWRSLTALEIEPPEITQTGGVLTDTSAPLATGMKQPETTPAPEGERFKPPFSDYLTNLASARLSLWGHVRSWALWVAAATMGMAIAAFALSTRGDPIARLTGLGWTAHTLPGGNLQLRFDRTQPPYRQSLDTLRSLPNRRLEMIFSAQVKSLDGFEALRELDSLTSVNLSGANIADVSALRELKSLTSLNLSRTKVADVSALRELKTLISLNLSATEVVDLSPLRELKGLTSLDLSGTKVVDVSALRELKTLISLNLSATEVVDLSPLRKL